MSPTARLSQRSGFATTTPRARRSQRAALTRARRTSSCTRGRACPWSSTCRTPPTSARTLVTLMRSLTSISRSSAAWCEIWKDFTTVIPTNPWCVRFERKFTRSWFLSLSANKRAKYYYIIIIYRSIFSKYQLKAKSAICNSQPGRCVTLCYSTEQWYSKPSPGHRHVFQQSESYIFSAN